MYAVPSDKDINYITQNVDEVIQASVENLPDSVTAILKKQPTGFLEGYTTALMDFGALVMQGNREATAKGMAAEEVQQMMTKLQALAVFCAQRVRANTKLN